MFLAVRRLVAFFRRRRLDDELAEEIGLHLELRKQALMGGGLTPAEAEHEARRQFGNVATVRERSREQWGGSSLDRLMHDVRHGVRLMGKSPGFSAVAIASLAVGIGASTVLFSFANSFLFRPLNAARPQQLIQIFTSDFDGPLYGASSYRDYEAFRQTPVFSDLLASTRVQEATLSGEERPDVITGLLVSGNYFEVLGLIPSRGRFFHPEEDQSPGTHPVLVLGYDAWRRRFGGDPAIVDRVVELNGRAFTVIGVGPPRFAGTSIEHVADFFVPVMMQDVFFPGTDLLRNRGHRAFRILGRLRDTVTLREATAALQVVAANLLREDPAAWRDRSGRGRVITAAPEIAVRFAGAGPGSVAFIFSSVIAGVVALLTIACVNVATLLLARATARRKEIAIRLAIGGSRRRVVSQLLAEGALLAGAGGALGLAIAHAVAVLFLRFRPEGAPAFDLTLDTRILLFSVAASLVTVVLFGLAPALQSTRPDLNAELKDMPRAVRVRGFRFGLRAGLVVTQVAVSLALIIGAALMLRSAYAGRNADPGFRRNQVLNVGLNLSGVRGGPSAHDRFYHEAARAVGALSGVERAALAALVPMDGSNSQQAIRIADVSISPDINIVGAGYFALLDIPLSQGREFLASDRGSSRVAVVNEAMAREFWNGRAVGGTFTDEQRGELIHIVGVVRDLRHRSFAEEPRPMVYFSAEQRSPRRMTLHIRTTTAPLAIAPMVQRTLRDVERTAGLTHLETMDDYFARVTMPQRLGAGAAAATGALQLGLAVMALYGVIAFTASQRRHEIALRMALGASRRSVIALIMREGLLLTAVGVAVGVAVAIVSAVALSSLLIGIGPADPVSVGGAVLLLGLVGAAASYLPARRALSADPSATLRSQ